MTSIIFISRKIHLSGFRPSDQAGCIEYLNEKEIYDRTLRIPRPYTSEAFDQWLALLEESRGEHGQPVHWAIRNETEQLIGGIGFDDIEIGKSHRAEVGYWLAKPYWGRSIMTAVVGRVCQHAFEAWGLVKITAHVFSFNAASARVLEKCGFQKEGFLRKHHLKDGQLIDAFVYGLVRD
jgi:[ribosomal protein S5]-alanine N-acetyltransferase